MGIKYKNGIDRISLNLFDNFGGGNGEYLY